MLNRRRRVSRTKKKDETKTEEDSQSNKEDVEQLAHEAASSVSVSLVQQKASSSTTTTNKRVKVGTDIKGTTTKKDTREWGSKQPKPVDADILKYALTTGGELARKSNEFKTKTLQRQKRQSSKDGKGEGDDDDEEEIIDETTPLRNALFKEIKEGEASLSCDKRGSRVVQNLAKDGTSEQVCELFERMKPYVGSLAYDPFASHVLQTLVDRCSNAESTPDERVYVSEFCEQISKANEWWAMMHDVSGTHVARSCAQALRAINDVTGLRALFRSLKESTQNDFRSASRNPNAGPFISIAIQVQPTEDERQTLLSRLFSDEKNDVSFDRKQFDSSIQDRTSSRVLDQVIPFCSSEFVREVLFEQGFVSPYLQRSAKHPFANFVVQRVVEKLIDSSSSLSRALKECSVQDMINFDRVGVLTSLAKAFGDSQPFEGLLEAQQKFAQDIVVSGGLDRATKSVEVITIKKEDKKVVSEAEDGETANQQGGGAMANVNAGVHLALAETVSTVFSKFSSDGKQPLLHQLLTWEQPRLVSLACDPVGGRKILEPILDGADREQGFSLAKRFKGAFSKLIVDRFAVHVARKAFMLLRKNDKITVMSDEIVPNKAKFSGYLYGSKFLSQLMLAEFISNPKEWAKKMEEQQSKQKEEKKSSIKEEWSKELGI